MRIGPTRTPLWRYTFGIAFKPVLDWKMSKSKFSVRFSLFAGLASLFVSAPVFGQQKACDLLPDYAKHEAELHRKYLENLKVTLVEKGYDSLKRTGKLEGTAQRTLIFGKGQMRRNSVFQRIDENEELISGSMLNREAYYTASKSNGQFEVVEHAYDNRYGHEFEEYLYTASAALPLKFDGHERMHAVDNRNERFARTGQGMAIQFFSLKEETFRGKKAAAIGSKHPIDRLCKTYFDPTNDYAVLGYDMARQQFDGTLFDLIVGEIVYEPSDLGYPVPKKYTVHYLEPDGKRIPRLEIDFLEWKRYEPTDEDFDLEKQFGMKPPPRTPRPEPPPAPQNVEEVPDESGKRPWLAAGLIFAFCSVLAFIVWRRHRKDTRRNP